MEQLAELLTTPPTARRVNQFRAYYDGDHPTRLSERQREFLNGSRPFAINYCRLVVDAVVERLKVIGFADAAPTTQAWLHQLWQQTRLDAISKTVHLATVRDGEAFLMLDYDALAGHPRFHVNFMDDGTSGVQMWYDADGNAQYALKRWRTADAQRATLYYPDRIERYILSADDTDWQPYTADGAPFPIPWVDASGTPLGIPVIHFRNRDQGFVRGTSELVDMLPLQDALNKTLLDLIAVADKNAFPLFVASGFQVPEDMSIAPGSLIQIPAQLDGTPEFKVIAGAALHNFIEVLQHLVMEIARVSSTPLSRFQASGQVAAEGTLKQQEAGLIAKVEHKQVTLGNAWEDAMQYAIRLQNTFGSRMYTPPATLSTLWTPAAPRSEQDHLQLLLLKAQLGVPVDVLLAEAGYAATEQSTIPDPDLEMAE